MHTQQGSSFRRLSQSLLCIGFLTGVFSSPLLAARAKGDAIQRQIHARAALADKLEAEMAGLKALVAELQRQLAAEKEAREALALQKHHEEQEAREREARSERILAAQDHLIDELHAAAPRLAVSIDESPKEEDW